MKSSNHEAFTRAIEQIRDGKLDSMLSQMFGSEPTTESAARRMLQWRRGGIEDGSRRNAGYRGQ